MLDWIININKDFPRFWKEYLSKLETKSERFVVISTETTGLSIEKDVILSISAFGIFNNAIHIGDNFETIIAQYHFFHENHISNEFTLETKMEKKSEAAGIEAFVNFIGNSILVGHHVDFDIEIINAALERLQCGRLKNEALDIDVMHQKLNEVHNKQFSISELCEIYKIPQNERDSSVDEAYKIALLFLKLKSRLGL